ncbi:hypothetical protein BD779DRAFT_1472806 [Infundibulicybe gibba]|nr:hypothetical protein BD779DRAFT_1472806 [Infundibulicybe gibba]
MTMAAAGPSSIRRTPAIDEKLIHFQTHLQLTRRVYRDDEKGGIDAQNKATPFSSTTYTYVPNYNRWANHEQSEKPEKMEDMQIRSSLIWTEVQSTKRTVEELLESRIEPEGIQTLR